MHICPSANITLKNAIISIRGNSCFATACQALYKLSEVLIVFAYFWLQVSHNYNLKTCLELC